MTQPDPITFSHPDGSKATINITVGPPVGSSVGGTVPLTLGYTYAPAPPPPLPDIILGDAYGLDLQDFPADGYGILFNSPGKGVNITQIAAFPKTILLCVCVKDPITAAMLAAMVAARGPYPMWVCQYQEPEAKIASAPYKAMQISLAGLIAALPAAQRFLVWQVSKLNFYAEEHGKGPWTDFWAGVEAVMGVDVYWAAGPDDEDYPDPEVLYADAIAWAKQAGVSLALTEWGLLQMANDPDGSRLALAIPKHITFMRKVGIILAAWWNGQGTNHNYVLTGKPLEAFREAMKG